MNHAKRGCPIGADRKTGYGLHVVTRNRCHVFVFVSVFVHLPSLRNMAEVTRNLP